MKLNPLFLKINSWQDFKNELDTLNDKQKGDAFELLTKMYFEIDRIKAVEQKTLKNLKRRANFLKNHLLTNTKV